LIKLDERADFQIPVFLYCTPRKMRMLILFKIAALTALASAQTTVYRLRWVGDYQTGAWDTDAAENIAFDSVRARAFIASAESGTVKVVSVTDPTDMSGARGRRRRAQIRTQAHTRPCAEHTRTREPQSLNLDTTPSMSRVSQRLAR